MAVTLPVFYNRTTHSFFVETSQGKHVVSASWQSDDTTTPRPPLSGTLGTFASPFNLSGTTHTLVMSSPGASQSLLTAPNIIVTHGATGTYGTGSGILVVPSASELSGRTLTIWNMGPGPITASASGQTGSLAAMNARTAISTTSDGTQWGVLSSFTVTS